jgi:hypothetical protein
VRELISRLVPLEQASAAPVAAGVGAPGGGKKSRIFGFGR